MGHKQFCNNLGPNLFISQGVINHNQFTRKKQNLHIFKNFIRKIKRIKQVEWAINIKIKMLFSGKIFWTLVPHNSTLPEPDSNQHLTR